MKRKGFSLVLALAILVVVLTVGGAALAQSSASYNLEWHALGGGGGPASSDSYAVHSIAGQTASGASPLSSDSYELTGGYWGGGGFQQWYLIHLPVVLRYAP
jgi:hypothetical protein